MCLINLPGIMQFIVPAGNLPRPTKVTNHYKISALCLAYIENSIFNHLATRIYPVHCVWNVKFVLQRKEVLVPDSCSMMPASRAE